MCVSVCLFRRISLTNKLIRFFYSVVSHGSREHHPQKKLDQSIKTFFYLFFMKLKENRGARTQLPPPKVLLEASRGVAICNNDMNWKFTASITNIKSFIIFYKGKESRIIRYLCNGEEFVLFLLKVSEFEIYVLVSGLRVIKKLYKYFLKFYTNLKQFFAK